MMTAFGILLIRLLRILCFCTWIFGFVIAKGFWSTLFCIIPFWSWYLVIEHVAKSQGWI